MQLDSIKLKNKDLVNNLVNVHVKKNAYNDFVGITYEQQNLMRLFYIFGKNKISILFVTAEIEYLGLVKNLAWELNQFFMGPKLLFGYLSTFNDFYRHYTTHEEDLFFRGYRLEFPNSLVSFGKGGVGLNFELIQSLNYRLYWAFARKYFKRFKFKKFSRIKLYRRKLLYISAIKRIDFYLNRFLDKFKYNSLFSFLKSQSLFSRFLLFFYLNEVFNITSFGNRNTDVGCLFKRPEVLFAMGSGPGLLHFISEAKKNGLFIIALTNCESIVRLADYSVYFSFKYYDFFLFFIKELICSYKSGINKTKLIPGDLNAYLDNVFRKSALFLNFSSVVKLSQKVNSSGFYRGIKFFYWFLLISWFFNFSVFFSKKWGLRSINIKKLIWGFRLKSKSFLRKFSKAVGINVSFFFFLFNRFFNKQFKKFSLIDLTPTFNYVRFEFDSYLMSVFSSEKLHLLKKKVKKKKIVTWKMKGRLRRKRRKKRSKFRDLFYSSKYLFKFSGKWGLRSVKELNKLRTLPYTLNYFGELVNLRFNFFFDKELKDFVKEKKKIKIYYKHIKYLPFWKRRRLLSTKKHFYSTEDFNVLNTNGVGLVPNTKLFIIQTNKKFFKKYISRLKFVNNIQGFVGYSFLREDSPIIKTYQKPTVMPIMEYVKREAAAYRRNWFRRYRRGGV